MEKYTLPADGRNLQSYMVKDVNSEKLGPLIPPTWETSRVGERKVTLERERDWTKLSGHCENCDRH